MRWVTPNRPLRPEETADLLDRIVRHWNEHGFGLWAVVPREPGGECIGFAGPPPPSFLRAALPGGGGGGPPAPGGGARAGARGGARGSLDFGFERLGLRSI